MFTHDVREDIFASISNSIVHASILADQDGIVCDIDVAVSKARELGLQCEAQCEGGARVAVGDPILELTGPPMAIAVAEDRLIGILAKPSGIATAARQFVDASQDRLTVVSGAWKKMPIDLKLPIRRAAVAGGALPRIAEPPFLYLDKNYTRMFGGISQTLKATSQIPSVTRVIQVGGIFDRVENDAIEAAQTGADVVFIDTGEISDIAAVHSALEARGLRQGLKLAFGGSITLAMVAQLSRSPVDIIDVGRAIVDAPLLDMRLAITKVKANQ